MRITTFSILFAAILLGAWGCTKNRGCTEPTADNYDASADENDGTCIQSRDKMIGSFTYTRIWTDVLTERDSTDVGSIMITESNSARNAFNMNLNGGKLILFGSTNAYDITIKPFNRDEVFGGQTFTRSFSGTGTWFKTDSVNFSFNLITQVPMWDQSNPPKVVTVPQTYNYYCTKRP